MKIMRARLLEKKQEEQRSEIAATRKLMVGSGDRSERIRTYNFPKAGSRITGSTLRSISSTASWRGVG
jgi:peptide chain release factor 1